jgi:leucyl aminopeptidase
VRVCVRAYACLSLSVALLRYTQSHFAGVSTILDFATLTGACMVALGHHAAGVWSNSDELVSEIGAAAAKTADERVWRMPLFPGAVHASRRHGDVDVCGLGHCDGSTVADGGDAASEHKKELEHPECDLKHTGGRAGGANTAASFLEEFIEEGVQWMHLDIAGASGTPGGLAGNGWGVQTIVMWLKSLE